MVPIGLGCPVHVLQTVGFFSCNRLGFTPGVTGRKMLHVTAFTHSVPTAGGRVGILHGTWEKGNSLEYGSYPLVALPARALSDGVINTAGPRGPHAGTGCRWFPRSVAQAGSLRVS